MTQLLAGRVLVQDPAFRMEDVIELLAPLGLRAERVEGPPAGDDVVALLGTDDFPVSVEDLERLPALRAIVTGSVGFDHISLDAAAERGIWVLNTPGFCTTEVADSTIAHILGLVRATVFLDRDVRSGGWDRTVVGELRRVSSTRLGVVGFGRIGREVARRAAALGFQVIVSDPSPGAVAVATSAFAVVELDELLATSDVVSLHVPLDRDRPPLIGAREIERMPDGAMLVNTSRGGLVDPVALTSALRDGRLRAAALDVLPDEPPAADHPLRTLPNVILTPHAAWYSREAERDAFHQPIEALVELARGGEPDGIVVRGAAIASRDAGRDLVTAPEPLGAAEGRVAVPGGEVWYRAVGEGGPALVLLHGGPGVPHDYLVTHDVLARDRRLVYYDQLGCGRSDRPDDLGLWTVERFVAELDAVRAELDLGPVHLLGQSWGGSLALAYALTHPAGVASIVLSSAPASARRYGEDALSLKLALPPDVLEELEWHEDRGFTDCPEYHAASMAFNRRHVCRLPRWPEEFHRSMANVSGAVYEQMWGPNDWRPTGVLRDWDVTDRLGEISVPVLLLAGRYDMCTPEHVADMDARLPRSRAVIFEQSSHLPFFEEADRYMTVVSDFLAEADEEA